MPRPSKPPSYLRHVGRDGRIRARVRIDGKDVPLGPYGSPESRQRYQEEIARWTARQAGATSPSPELPVKTVADLVARFMAIAETSRPAGELDNFRLAVGPLVRLYGSLPVEQFGPKALKKLREAAAAGNWYTPEEIEARNRAGGRSRIFRWSRRYLNRHVVRIKAVFGWGVAEELIPAAVHQALLAVKSLRRKEIPSIRELGKIRPVPEADLEATLPHLPPIPHAMVMTQLLTGARPGEVIRLRPCDLQRSGAVEIDGVKIDVRGCWVLIADPDEDPDAEHKTAYLGHRRVILFGPKAQAILAPYLEGRAEDRAIFSPAEALAQWYAGQRAKRRSKVQPSQVSRRKDGPLRREPGDVYDRGSYARAISRAIRKAGCGHWHPNQLRHNAGTRIRAEFGIEVARILLGHQHVKTTEIYAEGDILKAIEAMKRAG